MQPASIHQHLKHNQQDEVNVTCAVLIYFFLLALLIWMESPPLENQTSPTRETNKWMGKASDQPLNSLEELQKGQQYESYSVMIPPAGISKSPSVMHHTSAWVILSNSTQACNWKVYTQNSKVRHNKDLTPVRGMYWMSKRYNPLHSYLMIFRVNQSPKNHIDCHVQNLIFRLHLIFRLIISRWMAASKLIL